MFENIVYILGADHQTTLSVLRCIGESRINLKLLIHGVDSNHGTVISHSKYAKNVQEFSDDTNAIVDWLLKEDLKEKAFLIPCSDFASLLVDEYAEKLKDKYYLPGFKNNYGKVKILMDKMQQKLFSNSFEIPMADTWTIDSEASIPNSLCYPCIVKPAISANGKKSQIFVAYSSDELKQKIHTIQFPVIIQKYLLKKYEACAYGVMTDVEPYIHGVVIKKIHETSTGSTIYAKVIQNEEPNLYAKRICKILWDEGYRGLYDFELLVCDDGVYLNEINFRNSGNGYALNKYGIPAALIWCRSILNYDNSLYPQTINEGQMHINDLLEITNSKRLNISIVTALKNVFLCKGKAVWDLKDLSGTLAFYRAMIFKKLKIRRKK